MSVITDSTQTLQDVDVDVVLMIRNEYGEQPGLRLDCRQAARFCDGVKTALTVLGGDGAINPVLPRPATLAGQQNGEVGP